MIIRNTQYNKSRNITAILKVVATAEFYDPDATEETIRYCVEQDLEDAGFDVSVELMKEQGAMEPFYNEQKYGDHLPHCGNCEKVLPNNAVYGKVNFCHYCGQAVKWE